MTQTLKETRLSFTVHKTIIVQDSYRTSKTGRVRQIKFPYNGFKSVRLMSIGVIDSQNSIFPQMVIRKVVIVNAQPVKGNFATRKHYHLKLSARKFII